MAGPRDYQFDRSVFVLKGRLGYVELNGTTVLVQRARTYNPSLPYERLEYFEVYGLHYEYRVNVWTSDGRIRIDVCDKDTGALRSSMYPRNQQELLQAIGTIASDFKRELDDEFDRYGEFEVELPDDSR